MKKLPVVFFALLSLCSIAQQPYHYFISIYSGAAGNDLLVTRPRPSDGLSFGKYINNGMDLLLDASYDDVSFSEESGELYNYQALVKLKMNDGHILKTASGVAPFMLLGLSGIYFHADDQAAARSIGVPVALGIMVRLAEDLHVQFYSEYIKQLKRNVLLPDTFVHSIGLQFRW